MGDTLLGDLSSLTGDATSALKAVNGTATPATTTTAATSSTNILLYAGIAVVGILVLIFALGKK